MAIHLMKRGAKIESTYSGREPASRARQRTDALPSPTEMPSISAAGVAFIEKVRVGVESGGDSAACTSVLALDFSCRSWAREEWVACLDALVSYLASSQDASYTLEMLEGPRFIVCIRSAWEGEVVGTVRGLRQALWRYSPGIGVCEVIPGSSVREAVEMALLNAERAARGTVAQRYGGGAARVRDFVPAAA